MMEDGKPAVMTLLLLPHGEAEAPRLDEQLLANSYRTVWPNPEGL
jgi:hypothetical protein